ncbi:TetR/AcrR family transcriptional regulator [Corynebacterium guangdongense]|uniref:AcrR family transcriptional regulator n=1 Tax=Corynebacterium guangdongense TaxID=1783348 RepID=A0ABU1ZVH1_9CORY|nr:TetR/AcrR family transcriptional regulator [Corynebacterium guangdongense]MDR7328929.1 AcrR family transcriptional regulator [Corynebacterium guangdongense]WJZ17502.1 transcriptional regulator BetI [Corynebacterium guangdongense]
MNTRRRLSTAERRHDILTAAREHFRRSPFAEVSVPAIADDAGSSQSLIYHYFRSKPGLHTATVAHALESQHRRRAEALAALEDGQPLHYRVETLFLAHLDAIAEEPLLLPGATEPESTLLVRREAETAFAQELSDLIGVGDATARHRWAVTGIIGFLHRAAGLWSRDGFPADQRRPLIEATLGAMEGALGDWRVGG